MHVLGVPSKQEQALSRRPLIRDTAEKDPQVQNTVAAPSPLPPIGAGGTAKDLVPAAPDLGGGGVQRWGGGAERAEL